MNYALFLALVIAAPPRAVIQGPEPGIAGEILTLDATESEGDPTHYSWEITPEIPGRRQLKPFADKGDPDNSKVIVATFPGTYLLRLTVSNAEGHHTAYRQWTLQGKAPPTPGPSPVPPGPLPPEPQPEPMPEPDPPPPRPDPNPAPDPLPPPKPKPPEPLPAGEFNIAAGIDDIVDRLPSRDLETQRRRVAAELEAGAAKIAAGAVSTADQVIDNVFATALRAAGDPVWLDRGFASEVAAVLTRAGEAHSHPQTGRLRVTPKGVLIDPEAWSQLTREAAIGVRGAKTP